ncbi:MAG: hypothetical protein AAF799_00390 [Myxococcota bacterium]
MRHYELLTALPPAPEGPQAPAMPMLALVERCLPELGEADQMLVEALLELSDTERADEPVAADRDRMERALRLAQECGHEAMAQWLSFDRALREALAARRAAARGLDWPAPRPDVADHAASVAAVVTEAEGAATPELRERALDTARVRELEALVGGSPFSTEAVVARIVAATVQQAWDFRDDGELPEEDWR